MQILLLFCKKRLYFMQKKMQHDSRRWPRNEVFEEVIRCVDFDGEDVKDL